MVKIAIAGGTSNVAQEIIDVLVATKKHEILLLSRKGRPSEIEERENVSYAKTDYSSVEELAVTLRGYHTVLSFITPQHDQSEAVSAQKTLIDASIKAGVQRLAPNEWVTLRSAESIPWYSFKSQTREYLREINKEKKVLEYCLFQPGLFANYLTAPYKSAKHLAPLEFVFDFSQRRMLAYEGEKTQKITFTTVQDLAGVVAEAVEYPGEWPVVGGIKGSDLSFDDLVALGEEIRGPFAIEEVELSKLKDGTWSSSWLPRLEHPSFDPAQVDALSKAFTEGFLMAIQAGDLQSDDTWNTLLPGYRLERAEHFLRQAWQDKP